VTGRNGDDINRDLGLGSRVAQQSRRRFLNPDGSFNVGRQGGSFFHSLNLYHTLLTLSWPRFFLLVCAGYAVTNFAFAVGYILCGPGALEGARASLPSDRFLEAFFFSVQTLVTIGYGRMSPNGMAANILVSFEGLVGLLGFALATGLLFARFSRPVADIIFSKKALIAPYRGMTAFEFRIVNGSSNELIQVEATVVLSKFEIVDGKSVRKFHPLSLERQQVMFMPLHWVIVHPIDERSPLAGMTEAELDASDAEFLVLLVAIDETFAQTVHARTSYKSEQILWRARFKDMFVGDDDSGLNIDVRRLHDTEGA
jgi:inward rectifier potassium channel